MLNDIPSYILFTVCFCIVLMIITISLMILYSVRELKREFLSRRELEILKLKLEHKASKEDFEIIDRIIKSEFDKYELSHLHDAIYIHENKQKEIVKEISKKVLNRISSVELERLQFIYDIRTIETEVVERVQLLVIEYSIERNSNGLE